jgi:hypothetical protein
MVAGVVGVWIAVIVLMVIMGLAAAMVANQSPTYKSTRATLMPIFPPTPAQVLCPPGQHYDGSTGLCVVNTNV